MVKNPPGNVGDSRDVVGTTQVVPGSGRFLGGGNGTLSSITWGQSHGQRSLVGYSPWGRKELDMTEQLSTRCNCPLRANMHILAIVSS